MAQHAARKEEAVVLAGQRSRSRPPRAPSILGPIIRWGAVSGPNQCCSTRDSNLVCSSGDEAQSQKRTLGARRLVLQRDSTTQMLHGPG